LLATIEEALHVCGAPVGSSKNSRPTRAYCGAVVYGTSCATDISSAAAALVVNWVEVVDVVDGATACADRAPAFGGMPLREEERSAPCEDFGSARSLRSAWRIRSGVQWARISFTEADSAAVETPDSVPWAGR
jgi:hypothetical protein